MLLMKLIVMLLDVDFRVGRLDFFFLDFFLDFFLEVFFLSTRMFGF